MPSATGRPQTNIILDAIEADSEIGVGSQLKRVELERGTILCNAGDRLRFTYFPIDCVLSTLATLSDGSALQVNIFGAEGAYGIVAGVGSHEAAARVDVLVSGTAARVPIRLVRAEFERSRRFRSAVVRHFENVLFQIQQSAVCVARHPIEARLSRWLLAIHDRSPGDSMLFTHEFVADHLGANRTSVTLAAAALQRAGLINYRRGKVSIRDRDGLEESSCECYRAIRDRTRRLFRG
jgi:CRP-like cAMP-binding protein